jgi:RimJ/RimL family protein N-acetyltransferase
MTHAISLRDVQESDLPILFEYQRDPEATRMAAFPARSHDDFMAHWAKIMADQTTILRAILFHGEVAGSIVAWRQAGMLKVGYWIGRPYWGKGIATAALSQFLVQITERPLHAHVAKHNVASIRVLQKCGFTTCGTDTFHKDVGELGEEFIMALGAAVVA